MLGITNTSRKVERFPARIISFFAKRARGLMARYAITRRVETPRKLEQFNLEGYAFDPAASQAERLVFRRRTAT